MIAAEQYVRAQWDRSSQTLRREKWNGREPTEQFVAEGGSTDRDRQPTGRRGRSSADIRIPQGAAPSPALPFPETPRIARERILPPWLAMAYCVDWQLGQLRAA